MENCPQDHDFHIPDVVNSVLSKIDTVVEDSLASMGKCQEMQLASFDHL